MNYKTVSLNPFANPRVRLVDCFRSRQIRNRWINVTFCSYLPRICATSKVPNVRVKYADYYFERDQALGLLFKARDYYLSIDKLDKICVDKLDMIGFNQPLFQVTKQFEVF